MNQPVKISLAPIRGITNLAFRQAFHHHIGGIDTAIAPYFVCKIKPGEKLPLSEKDLAEINPLKNAIETEPQLLGKDPELIIAAIEQLTAVDIKQVNLNFGCPYPMVADKGLGSGALAFPDKLIPLIETILEKSPIPISIKLRLGRFDSHEIDQLFSTLNSPKIKEITLHPRIGKQLYSGTVDLNAFERAYHAINNHLCYNGDIVFKRDFEQLKGRFPAIDKWMIGRGMLTNLFLAHEIKDRHFGQTQKKEMLLSFVQELEDYYLSLPNGRSHFLHRQLDLWQYLVFHFTNPQKLYKKLKKCKDINSYLEQRSQIFDEAISTDGMVDSFSKNGILC